MTKFGRRLLIVFLCFFRINFLDIAPQHASVIVGISNTIGTIPGIVSPTLSGYLVQNKVNFVLNPNSLSYVINKIISFTNIKKLSWLPNGKKYFLLVLAFI